MSKLMQGVEAMALAVGSDADDKSVVGRHVSTGPVDAAIFVVHGQLAPRLCKFVYLKVPIPRRPMYV